MNAIERDFAPTLPALPMLPQGGHGLRALRAPAAWRERLRRERDTILAAAAMVMMLLVLSVAQAIHLFRHHPQDLAMQAELLSYRLVRAVQAHDAAAALGALEGLGRIEDSQAARLRLPDGRDLAVWQRQPGRAASPQDAHPTVEVPVLDGQREIARLSLWAGRGSVWHTLGLTLAGMLGILVATLVATRLAASRLRSDVRAAEERTRYLAHHDPLTGLVNRATFAAALEGMAQAADEGRAQAALLLLDVDNFKAINDTHGHAAGDLVLRTMGERLRQTIRSDDLAARLGGDEFALLLRSKDGGEAAARVASALVRELPKRILVNGTHLDVSISMGVALLPRDAATPARAMHCADVALYQAKRNGKDSWASYSPALDEAQRDRQLLERDLREAVAASALTLEYQPIFDREGRLRSFEALARWRHAGRGWVSPGAFIPVADDSGLIFELGLALLQRLRADLDAWARQGLFPPPVALNLSSRQFRRPEQRDRFLAALTELRLGPGVVEFELTETSVFEDLDSDASILPRLRGLGYTLAIDDFGTGYSSLAYLRRLKCRKLKIDRVFVHGVAQGGDPQMLVESILRVGHAMDMVVVAEGVETASDQRKLIQLGCDLFQGFGLARPLQPARAAQLMAEQEAGDERYELASGDTRPAPLFES